MGGDPYWLVSGVPLKKKNPIINICPKATKVINCHQPLEFKSCRRLWVTKKTCANERKKSKRQTIINKSITKAVNRLSVFFIIGSKILIAPIIEKPIHQNKINLHVYSRRLDLPVVLNQPLNSKLYNLLNLKLLTTKFTFTHQT